MIISEHVFDFFSDIILFPIRSPEDHVVYNGLYSDMTITPDCLQCWQYTEFFESMMIFHLMNICRD